MRSKTQFLLILCMGCLVMFAGINSCTKPNDKTNLCTNGVKDGDETAVDCGGSCNACTNPCDTLTCVNGATKELCSCRCINGYEGTECQTITRAKFLGNYLGYYKNDYGDSVSNVSVNISAVANDVTLINVGLLSSVVAIVDSQAITATPSFTIIPNGSYSGFGDLTSSTHLYIRLSELTGAGATTYIYHLDKQ